MAKMTTSNIDQRKVIYIIGEQRLVTEIVVEDDNSVITPTAVTAMLLSDTNEVIHPSLVVQYSPGFVGAQIPGGLIQTPGNFRIVWDVHYNKGIVSYVKRLITEVVSRFPDPSYLMRLVPHMRVWVNDDPRDPNMRLASDFQLKQYLVAGIKAFLSDRVTLSNQNGYDDIVLEGPVSSDLELLIVLYGAFLYLSLATEAIAREQTTMFSISYDSAYAQIQNRIDLIWGRIQELDDSNALRILSETDLEVWKVILQRTSDALASS